MHLQSVTPVHVACALLLVASCAGTPGLPSQPTPASLVAFLQSCQTAITAGSEHDYPISSCAYLAPNSTVTLQPGPPATLPLHTTLIGGPATGPLQPTCCDPSNITVASPSPFQHTNATATNSTTTSLTELDLSRLAPSSLVVPPNGTLSLHNLAITAAKLPTVPYPLPAASFLSLLPIRLSPGARLQLSSVTITTTSCASLALHQDLACRSAPSPNFTVTPTSLLVHSYTTASLAAQDVLLTCSGRQLPAPCIAAVIHSGAEVLREAWAWEQQGSSPPAPLYLYLQGTVQLSWLVARARSSRRREAGDDAPLADISLWLEVQKVLPGSTSWPISRGTLVVSGPPDRSSVLELSDSSSLFSIQGAGSLRLQHLTLRGLPLGPPERYPEALLRLPMWFAPALLSWVGRNNEPRLAVRNVTVELRPEEFAFWRDARGAELERLAEQASPGGADGNSAEACITDSGTVFSVQELAAVPGCSSCVLAVEVTNIGRALEIRDTLLVPPPLLSQQQQDSSGALGNQRSQPGREEQQQQVPGLRLPNAPYTPLCALAPGPGAQEAELLHQLITDTYLDAALRRPTSMPPPPSSSPPTPFPGSWWQGRLPPPLLRHVFPTGVAGFLYPNDLSYTFVPVGIAAYCTVLVNDARADTRNRHSDLFNFLRGQAVVQLPGTLLLGDPVGVRTLDLAGLPSAVVLEREPLTRAPSTWSSKEVPVLLPLLETVRQQRQAAGLRGLLTEPVSLTVRHLVLINLPAAGPFVRIPPPPGPPREPVWQPPGEALGRLLLTESPGGDGADGARGVRVAAGRGLRQAAQSPAVGGEGATKAGAAGTEGGVNAGADYLGGLPPSLANLTSCVWSLQLDRAAVVRAVRSRLQQGGTDGGARAGDGSSGRGSSSGGSSGSSSSGSDMQSPVDVSYVLLQSVQLVVPERELLLLVWAWATNATRHAAQPGLAEQLQLMLDSSRLAGGAGAVQQLLREPSGSSGGSAPALPPGLRLVFDKFVWCGLLGTNVTLTSQLPAPTPLSLQLPDLDLPVAYGVGPGGPQQGGNSAPEAPPPWVRGPPAAAVPQPSPALVGGPGTPAAGRDGQPGGVDDGSAAPGRTNGTMQPPAAAAAAAGGSGGGGSSTPPLPLGAAVALAVACAAVSVGAAAGVGIWLLRRRWGQAQAKMGGCELGGGQQLGQQGLGTEGADTSAKSHGGSCVSPVKHTAQREPRPPSLVLRHLVSLRLVVERNRQLVLGQQQEQQQKQQELPRQGTHRLPGAGFEACELAAQRGKSGGARLLVSSTPSSALPPNGDTGSGRSASVPGAGLGLEHSGSSAVARDEGGSDLSLALEPASSSNCGTGEVVAAAEPSPGGVTTLATANGSGQEGGPPRESVGGSSNRDSSNTRNNNSTSSSGSPPLVLLRELGRGAQGVVYAGRWRGLDVAVKSVLVQRLRIAPASQGSPNGGGLWHGPSLHSALSEGSISSTMSHPHVVATYATFVQGPEGEEQGVVEEQARDEEPPEGGAAGGPGMPASEEAAVRATAALQSSREPVRRSVTAAAALEAAAELHELHVREGVGSEVIGAGTAADSGSSVACGDISAAERQVPYPGQQSADTVSQQNSTERSEPSVPAQAAPRLSQSAQLPTPGAAAAQVQVWKLTLVQELCTGGSLRDSLLAGRLARRGGGPWPRALHPAAALRLALHVARGSAHLHHHGVLWNDLSSANVLLQLGRRGEGTGEAAGAYPSSGDSSGALDFVAKVADFGLSRRLPAGATHASETAGRSGLYVAPEVVRYGRCTPASDVYAYGVLLWEVAAGVPLPELLSQPEGGAVRSWLAQQAFVPPEEAEALPAELLAWPGAEQQHNGGWAKGAGTWNAFGTSADVDGGALLPAGYVALAEQCLRQDPRQRPSFEVVCNRLTHLVGPTTSAWSLGQ